MAIMSLENELLQSVFKVVFILKLITIHLVAQAVKAAVEVKCGLLIV